MDISLYIPYHNPPYNIPFITIQDLLTFCKKHDIKGIIKNSQYHFNINKTNSQKLFFLVINDKILTIPQDTNRLFKLNTNYYNITIYFQPIINKKYFNLLSRLENNYSVESIIKSITIDSMI